MGKKIANFDTTYCTNEKCKDKCWRHVSNFEFEKNQNYWFQDKCINPELSMNIPVNEREEKVK